MSGMSNYYSVGSAAKRIEYDVYKENQVLRNRKIRKSLRKIKIKLMMSVLFVFFCSMFMMYRYAQITDLNYRINESQKTLGKITNENLKLKVRIDRSLDLSMVRDIAISRLGMHKPERYQMVAVSVPKDDYVKYNEKAEQSIKDDDIAAQPGMEMLWKNN